MKSVKFGEIDIADGWYQILYDMCQEIAETLENSIKKPLHIVVEQVKEKFGSLRFYYHFEGMEQEIDVIDIKRKISKIVEKYEDKSEKVCEICGREGKVRSEPKWMRTLCDICYLSEKE